MNITTTKGAAMKDGFDWMAPTEEHRDGVWWYDAPIPPRFHRCWVQTEGWIGFSQVWRCACGAIRNPGISRRWMERNSRRKGQ